ncbi:hypothetical protein J7E45_08695 [Microbacterium sp. ISL-59]|uniref:hypothetical protein n=1 Tax=Microbacterium sp. ISL-59 TaxID=2819159 RepID=UPI001BEB0956|nr:hypothetical protein [Microbacterium sp. ISL-59]MBT2495685.1 hypothetical protein [Microbacterium sp. ISL-59]
MKPRHVAAALLLLPMLALAACTPGATGTLGLLRQDDGSLDVLVRLCHGSVDLLTLRAINSYPPNVDSASGDDGGWRNVDDKEFSLPTPIVGDAEIALPFREQALGSDVLFHLTAFGDKGENAVSGHFAASELADVQPGEVFTPIGMFASDKWESSDDPIVSPEEFERFADDFCS